MKISQFATFCLTCLLIISPVAAFAQPYAISADGLEVTDQKTGLIWRRCAEGMVFSYNTCTGTAATYTYDQALAQAIAVSTATQTVWRVPNVKELASIADISLSNPVIDATAFPATPANWFWSSTPYVGIPANAWVVGFDVGSVSQNLRTNGFYVRLVRAGQ